MRILFLAAKEHKDRKILSEDSKRLSLRTPNCETVTTFDNCFLDFVHAVYGIDRLLSFASFVLFRG